MRLVITRFSYIFLYNYSKFQVQSIISLPITDNIPRLDYYTCTLYVCAVWVNTEQMYSVTVFTHMPVS